MLLYQNLKKLKDYKPKTRGCTSVDEINMIKTTLDLEHASDDDVQNYRDMCVLMWEHMFEYDSDAYGKIDSLQSITGVIDLEKLKRGMEV